MAILFEEAVPYPVAAVGRARTGDASSDVRGAGGSGGCVFVAGGAADAYVRGVAPVARGVDLSA